MTRPLGLRAFVCGLLLFTVSLIAAPARADEAYARTRDYHLENVRVHLRFDLDQRKVMGEANETLVSLRDGLDRLRFDSVDLAIESVSLNGKPAKFELKPGLLIVLLSTPAHSGEKFEVAIRYSGRPKKGLYFVLPDKNYPNQPKEIWTQGESEDTRYYIPLYDYPNDMTSSEMLLTVPADWVTISNGKLISVKPEPGGLKTWDWKEPRPHSTYLISIVAGEFVEKKELWRRIPVEYLVPRGGDEKIRPTFEHTPQMLEFFTDRIGVAYPWEQYATSAVDDFVEGGMENVSATTIGTRGLEHPALRAESSHGSDGLLSHELAHQWFGDLVTCKDWSHIWLNEGFATYFEHAWTEHFYGKDEAAYEFWRDANMWNASRRLFAAPIVTHSFSDAVENAGNEYNKASWVLHMLNERLGDDNFFRAIRHYLEVNRGHNVTTPDFAKAVEESTNVNVDRFLDEWIFGAGAPRFEVRSTYDAAAHAVKLEVKQPQKIEGRVGLFHVSVEVEITTPSGRRSSPIEVGRNEETFTFPADAAPLMVLFDKGDTVLKTVDFPKSPAMLLYQLKNAETVPDRANAARSLGEVKSEDAVIAALAETALHDSFWGVRLQAIQSLGSIGGPAARQGIEAALANEKPWVRVVAVEQLANFKDAPSVSAELEKIFREDKAYTVRAAALRSLAALPAPGAYEILTSTAQMDSPDDVLRAAALRGMGTLGDDRAVPALLAWSATGKLFPLRAVAISGLGRLDKKNKDITRALINYLHEPYFSVRFPVIFALGERGDPDAIPELEAFMKSGDISLGFQPLINVQIDRIRGAGRLGQENAAGTPPASRPSGNDPNSSVLQALQKIEHEIEELNSRMAKLEQHISNEKK